MTAADDQHPARRGPVAALIERLGGGAGPSWIAAALGARPFSGADIVLTGGAHPVELDSLVRLKSEGKRLAHRGETPDERSRGVFAYFLAVAFAVAHHDRLISSRPRAQVARVLEDLSGAAPPPWRDTFAAAAERLASRRA